MPRLWLCLCLCTTIARAQVPTAPATEAAPHVPAAGHSLGGETFDDGPRQGALLLEGMGKVVFPVSTAVPDAQRFVSQGVAQLHGFYYLEAERSFRQAAKLDPGCPMAYWGMSMANVNNAKRAKGLLEGGEGQGSSTARRPSPAASSSTWTPSTALYKEGGDRQIAANKKEHLLGLEAIVAGVPQRRSRPGPGWRWSPGRARRQADIGSRQALDVD